MNPFKTICFCFALFALGASDTFHRAFLVNTTSNPVLVISNVEIKVGNRTLLKFAEERDGQFIHELSPNSEYVLTAELDAPITTESFPCEWLIIVSGSDTMRHNSRAEIMAAMNVLSEERMELRIE